MSENSKIEWTTHTFNPWIGCAKVSPGCANCYAEILDTNRFSKTLGSGTKDNPVSHWGKGKPRHRTSESNWKDPLKWNRKAQLAIDFWEENGLAMSGFKAPNRPRVFCASLADWLDDEVPIEWLADLLELIRRTPNLDWLLLTKRPENFRARLIQAQVLMLRDVGEPADPYTDEQYTFVKEWLLGIAPDNVWLGTTVEDQARADERIPLLLQIPAKVRFLSCEPLLEPVDLERAHRTKVKLPNWPAPTRVDWVIAGGESGSKCRHFSADWARDLRDQCKAAGVAFFMKQMGGTKKPFEPIPDDLMIREFPGGKEGA